MILQILSKNLINIKEKKTLIYNDKKYLVKFPDPIIRNKNISYINNAFFEYVGSNIFHFANIEVQNTILGKYNYNGKDKIVCACEDFTDDKHILYEFENLALSSNPDKKIETEISDIMEVLEENNGLIDVTITKQKFWDMFIIDSIIGNTDRHNGNWGFILNKEDGGTKFAPIYDCGSSLNPILEDNELENLGDTEIKNLAVNAFSCLKENGKKVNYMAYIKSMHNEECNKGLVRCFNNIEIDKIENFIDEIEGISKIRKEFYKKIIRIRYDILKRVYNKLIAK